MSILKTSGRVYFLFSFFQCLQKYQPRGTVDPPKIYFLSEIRNLTSAKVPRAPRQVTFLSAFSMRAVSPEDTDIHTQLHLSSSHSQGTFLVVLRNLSEVLRKDGRALLCPQ